MTDERKSLRKMIFYPIPPREKAGRFKLEIHQGAQLLNIDTRMDTPRLWAIADTSKDKVFRDFAQFGKDEEVSETNLKYMGSYQFGNLFTFQVFEIVKG